ncbi:hypothetical protein [Nitrospira sp. NS4]|uniref:hypothetical protein n=1 Tax=Nitrospira sp. NS4 TaxID=3414498 RepID=UPI003C2D9F0A
MPRTSALVLTIRLWPDRRREAPEAKETDERKQRDEPLPDTLRGLLMELLKGGRADVTPD